MQGIGFYFSSGDDGDDLETWGVKHPDYPTGDPWVTSVGGTSIAIGKDNTRLWETGWGTTLYALADNGKSWVKPGRVPRRRGRRLQPGLPPPVVPGRASSRQHQGPRRPGHRAWTPIRPPACSSARRRTSRSPSVFGPAGIHYGEYRIGGTSLASPLMAGVQAVAQGSGRLGFANPRIYHLARVSATPPEATRVLRREPSGRRRQRPCRLRQRRSTPTTAPSSRCARSTRTARSRRRAAGTTSPASARRPSKYLDEIAWGW